MDILFLTVGAILWLFIAVFEYFIFGGKIALFIAIMVLFFIFVLAYGILSIYKYFMAKLNYIIQNKIIEWDNGYAFKRTSVVKKFVICAVFGMIIGIVLIAKQASYIPSLFGALGAAFVSFGWVLMGTKRTDKIKSDVPGFLLSHIGLIYNGKAEVFNGSTKGILSAAEKDGYLILEILRGKKTEKLELLIPENKKADVKRFIEDMKDFFNENKQETT